MAQQQRTNERTTSALATQRAHIRRLIYPQALTKLPLFENWFPIVVVESIAKREEVQGDVISINTPPSNITTTYHFMYTFGNHLQMANAKLHLSTSNSGIAATFE
jgi:hypothetical protein